MTTLTVVNATPEPVGLTFRDLLVGSAFAFRADPTKLLVKSGMDTFLQVHLIGTGQPIPPRTVSDALRTAPVIYATALRIEVTL